MNKEQALHLYVVLSRAYHSVAEADKKMIVTYGLSPSEFAVLELLLHKGPQPIQYIASKVLLKSGSMTYVVTQLEKKKLLKRVVSNSDKRVFYAELTKKGEALIKEIYPKHEEFLYNMMNIFSKEEAFTLSEQLKSLGKSLTNRKEVK